MFFVDVTNPIILLVTLFLIICLIYLGKESKNAYLPVLSLIACLVLLVMHGIQFLTLPVQYLEYSPIIGRCIGVDFILVFLSYISYLWVDEIESKAKNKKSIDNSLEWFWREI